MLSLAVGVFFLSNRPKISIACRRFSFLFGEPGATSGLLLNEPRFCWQRRERCGNVRANETTLFSHSHFPSLEGRDRNVGQDGWQLVFTPSPRTGLPARTAI